MVARSRFTIPAWLAVALAGCGDEPPPLEPPMACGTIPRQTVTVSEQVLVVPCFEDPEMGALTLAVVSSNAEVATAEMLGDHVRIAGVSPGTATITVTATDPDGLTGELTFEALVPNRAPALLRELLPTRMHTEDPPLKLVLSEYFADPDGQQLTYGATSSDTAVASVAVTADTLVVAGGSQGEVTVSVTATDPGGLTATARMTVMVRNRPPVVARELPPTRIQLGAPPVRLVLSEYFSDPDGEPLNFGATSSDTTVASVAVTADTLAVAGVSRGKATVSVTATDAGGLSVTARMDVTVASNRPPVVLKEMLPGLTIPRGSGSWSTYRELSRYFSDPDDDRLTYAATVSDTTVASLVFDNNRVTVTGVSPGRVTVTTTATDPGGLSATTKWEVRVIDNVLPFRDDFDSGASLENWEVWEATTADISDGKLRLTNTDGMRFATVRRPVQATDWTVTARMGNVTEESWVQLAIRITPREGAGGLPRYFLLQVGEDPDNIVYGGNWRLMRTGWYGDRVVWYLLGRGSSEAVAPVGELTDVTLSVKDNTFSVVIGDEEVFSSRSLGLNPNIMINLWFGVWPKPGTTGKTGVVDWVEVTGSPYTAPQMLRTSGTGEFPSPARPPAAVERPRRPERHSGDRVQGRAGNAAFRDDIRFTRNGPNRPGGPGAVNTTVPDFPTKAKGAWQW